MKFGVFDHLDDAGVPLGELFAGRLKLAEAYDRSGFHAYHLAEHHGTPLGCAASPSIFLAALAQRTTRLRFGPMVYLLPFYHPLRLIEEVCMLDQMSGGRLELGIGRGVSPFETANYALDFAQTQPMYHEAFQVLLKGLASDELSFAGKFYRFDKVPMILHPVQRPHPPLWYGVGIPDNADWPAQNDVNILSLAPRATVGPIFERYHAVRRKLGMDRYDALRCRPACRRRRNRRQGARHRAPRLSALAHELLLAVRAQQLGAAHRTPITPKPSTNWQALGTAIAGSPRDRAQFHRRGRRGDRRELLDALACLRRHDDRRSPALDRPVRARSDAGVLARRGASRPADANPAVRSSRGRDHCVACIAHKNP